MSEHLRKRGDVWYGTVNVHNPDGSVTRIERSTGCSDKAAARTVRAGWEREAADPHHAAARTTINDALTLLLEERASRVPENDGAAETVEYYRYKVGHLVRVFGHDTPVSTFRTSAPSWRYIDQRRHEGAHTRTIAKELKVLRTALHLARSRGAFSGDPDVVYPADFVPAEDDEPGRSLTRQEALKLWPLLAPDAAAAMAFALATGAEMSALKHARREDLPNDIDAAMSILVRGTKNEHRAAHVPIVTDEQKTLLRYVALHAGGNDGALFGPSLSNLHRAVSAACDEAGIEHASPHDWRRTAGQWLIDLGAALELVSRFMRHADTRITETVYARIRDEDVADRILDSIDPRYARVAHKSRPKKPVVETITSVPSPKKARETLYRVGDVERSLSGWAQASGVSKATLHYRLNNGLTMAEAIGRGRRELRATSAVSRSKTAAPVPQTGRTPGHSEDTNDEGSLSRPLENLSILARPGRFERPTTGSVDQCSIQLSYGRNPPKGDAQVTATAPYVKPTARACRRPSRRPSDRRGAPRALAGPRRGRCG